MRHADMHAIRMTDLQYNVTEIDFFILVGLSTRDLA